MFVPTPMKTKEPTKTTASVMAPTLVQKLILSRSSITAGSLLPLYYRPTRLYNTPEPSPPPQVVRQSSQGARTHLVAIHGRLREPHMALSAKPARDPRCATILLVAP